MSRSLTWSAVCCLTLSALMLGACGTAVSVVHTIPPEYNLAPAKTVVIISDQYGERGDEGLSSLVLRHLKSRGTFEVLDRRDLAVKESLDTHEEVYAFGHKISAEILVRIFGPYGDLGLPCEAVSQGDNTVTGLDKDGNQEQDYLSTNWLVDCEASLAIYDVRAEQQIAGFTVTTHTAEAISDDGSQTFDDALDDLAWQLVDSFTPRQVKEGIDIDKKAPLGKEGIAKIDHQDLAGARALWEEALKTQPDSAPLQYNLGAVCEALGDRKAARQHYREASRLAPAEAKYQQVLKDLEDRRIDAKVAKQGDAARPKSAEELAAEAAATAAQAAEKVADEAQAQTARERAALIARNPRLVEKTAETYLLIPAGTFIMGCTAGDDACSDGEKPAHPVTISKPFYMASTPTTKHSYQTCIDAGVCRGLTDPAKPQHPAVNIRWDDAKAYCAWIGGRLPTEAEWEYAARGGTEGWRFPWGNEITPENANFATAKNKTELDAVDARPIGSLIGMTYPYEGTCPVQKFAGNGFGLYDMAGNVLEWTQDWNGPYAAGPATDPQGPATGEVRVLRGGSWAVTGNSLRVSHRFSFGPDNQVETIGFRCAIDP